MKTSVAMTTYNGRKYIEELLDSIKNQDVQPDEVIICDDASTDDTFDYINNYIEVNKLQNWNCFRNKINLGWRANFREAFKRCSGELVFLCDQDDIWMPYKIKEMKRVMEENTEIQLLISNYSVLNIDREEKIQIFGLDRNDGSIEKSKFKNSSLTVMRPGCTYCVRSSLICQLWEEDLITEPHDAMLWGYATIDETLYLFNRKTIQFRRHSESASTPQNPLCIERRLNEIMSGVKFLEFFLNKCNERGYTDKGLMIDKHIKFSKERMDVLQSKSIFKMIKFQINHLCNYPTVRNMLSDVYIILHNR